MLKGRSWSGKVKTFVRLAGLVVLASGWVSLVAETAAGPAAPNMLRCEYMDDPLGVDTTEPRFQWVLEHSDRAEKQTAYQVLVATKADLLKQDHGDQWDSGKVASDESTQVVYAGKPLESGRNYSGKSGSGTRRVGRAGTANRPGSGPRC